MGIFLAILGMLFIPSLAQSGWFWVFLLILAGGTIAGSIAVSQD